MTEQAREEERLRAARLAIAQRLQGALELAIAAGLSNEAAMIAKLIDAMLSSTLVQLYRKLM